MSGDVTINILDGGAGAVVIPAASLQVVIGPASSGTAAQIVASKNPNTLKSVFGGGPLVEAAALAINAGGAVLAIRAATTTPGSASAVTHTGTGTSVVTVTGTPVDEYYVVFKPTKAGTIGANGIQFQLSLDAGRTYGPVIALGTAVTYAIAGTGITLNFAAGTIVVGDLYTFGTEAPQTDTASVSDCLDALFASQYAVSGWGSMHVVQPFSAADANTINGYLETFATNFVYTRAIVEARDASPAAKWGGSAESEQDWIDSVSASVSAISAKRVEFTAGHYNMPTAYPTSVCGTPKYRRPYAWARAARQVAIPPQRHAGRVRDGAYTQVTIDPTSDPADGFVYHDERITQGLTAARISTARTRLGQPGLFADQPNLLSPVGSVFSIAPFGNVMDIACTIAHQVGEQEINSDIRLNDNGTIFENEAQQLERVMGLAIKTRMLDNAMISNYLVTVDRTNNIRATSEVKFEITIFARGYVLSETITIGYGNAAAAGGA